MQKSIKKSSASLRNIENQSWWQSRVTQTRHSRTHPPLDWCRKSSGTHFGAQSVDFRVGSSLGRSCTQTDTPHTPQRHTLESRESHFPPYLRGPDAVLLENWRDRKPSLSSIAPCIDPGRQTPISRVKMQKCPWTRDARCVRSSQDPSNQGQFVKLKSLSRKKGPHHVTPHRPTFERQFDDCTAHPAPI